MEHEIEKFLEKRTETYIYLKDIARYYWVERKKFFNSNDVCSNLLISQWELKRRRKENEIKSYDGICYLYGDKKWYYNLLNHEDIIDFWTEWILVPEIKDLIDSIGWYSEKNIEYIHKAILYKYLNIDDYSMPSIVFYGVWWSGKSSFITFLWTIFWEDNIMWNLGQRDITSSFDTYKGQKIIVEFAEITTNNTHSDIRILNKLKNIIGAEKITVNEKGVQPYQIENIAWFFISSNSNHPIQLDDKSKWNRRFSIVKSIKPLKNGKQINEAIRDENKVRSYISWLKKTYLQEVREYKNFPTLENKDKAELEEISQNEANQFWDWLSEKYPDFKGKKNLIEIREKLNEYCLQADISDQINFDRFFWKNSKYPKKKIRFWEKVYTWVNIE